MQNPEKTFWEIFIKVYHKTKAELSCPFESNTGYKACYVDVFGGVELTSGNN